MLKFPCDSAAKSLQNHHPEQSLYKILPEMETTGSPNEDQPRAPWPCVCNDPVNLVVGEEIRHLFDGWEWQRRKKKTLEGMALKVSNVTYQYLSSFFTKVCCAAYHRTGFCLHLHRKHATVSCHTLSGASGMGMIFNLASVVDQCRKQTKTAIVIHSQCLKATLESTRSFEAASPAFRMLLIS